MISSAAARGYRYLGPCRSGLGPFAFYISPDGRIVHAWQVYGYGFPYYGSVPPYPPPYPYPGPWTSPGLNPSSEAEALRAERDQLRRELEDLNRRLRELEGGGK